MAVTILTTAQAHTSAYNNQNLVASSTNSAQTNFKYVVTVQINNGYYDQDVTLRIPARPDNSKLYFNPQRIAEAKVKSTFSTTALDFFCPSPNLPSEFKKVTIGVDEEYGSPVSGFGGASASYFIWNGAMNAIDFSNYTYSTTTSSKDLTLSPSLTDTIHYDQKYLYKSWERGFSTRDLYRMTIDAYNAAGSIIQTSVIENFFYDISNPLAYVRNYVTLNCSPYGLNNFTGTIVSKSNGLLDIIPNTTLFKTARYEFYFKDNGGPPANVSSNTNIVYVDDFCSNYTRYVLHFLNRLGNYDSFTFNMLSRANTEKETDSYKKIPYALDGSNYYRYEEYTGDTVIYNTVLTNKMTLNSDWINDAESLWLLDLINSPDIKLEIPDDANVAGDSSALISVKCTLKNYETKKQVNDKLFNITIEIENSLQDVRQRA